MLPVRGAKRREDTGHGKNESRHRGDDATLTQHAVDKVHDLLDRRGVRGGKGGASAGGASASNDAKNRAARNTRKAPPVVAPPIGKPKLASKKTASAHNAKILAAASVATDLSTNSGKANAFGGEGVGAALGNNKGKGGTPYGRIDASSLGKCGVFATGNGKALDETTAEQLNASANFAAVAAAAERKRKRVETGGDDDELCGIDTDDDDEKDCESEHDTEQWEDVEGKYVEYRGEDDGEDFEAAGPDGTNDGNDMDKITDGTTKKEPRRVTPAVRLALKDLHKTHLLCCVARAQGTTNATTDPFVQTLVASLAPRDLFQDALRASHSELSNAFDGAIGQGLETATSGLPSVQRVSSLAKWFTSVFETEPTRCTGNTFTWNCGGGKAGSKNSGDSKNRNSRKNAPQRPASKFARVKVVDEVIVLDDDDDEVVLVSERIGTGTVRSATTRGHASSSGKQTQSNKNTGMSKQSDADPKTQNPNTFAQHASSALRRAILAAAVSPKTRLMWVCVKRKGTQEDLSALFVACAQGLGYQARLVTAIDPVPHKAGIAALERIGVVRGDTEGTSTDFPYFTNETRTDVSCEPITHWAEVLTTCDTASAGSIPEGYPQQPCWVPVVPHTVGCGVSEKRRSFLTGTAAVDDLFPIFDKAVDAPYVLAFSGSGCTCAPGATSSPQTNCPYRNHGGFSDVTRKYSLAYSKRLEKRCESEWVARTIAIGRNGFGGKTDNSRVLAIGRNSDKNEVPASSLGVRQRAIGLQIHHADARDVSEMATRAATEKLPSTLTEIKNHPLYVVEEFLKQNEVVYPRKPVLGFINGACVFPRQCVSVLRSATRWQTDQHREVLVDQLAKPASHVHSKASRRKLAFEKKRAEQEAVALRKKDDATATLVQNPEKQPKQQKRRPGPRSVEEVARGDGEGGVGGGGKKDTSRGGVEKYSAKNKAQEEEKTRGDIPLYGVWQTVEWDVSGFLNLHKVPINSRGNVDLISQHSKPPPGCVHVSLPHVSRVARRLREESLAKSGVTKNSDATKTGDSIPSAQNLNQVGNPFDYAPALVGFDFRRGGVMTPKFDGVVVLGACEELLRLEWSASEKIRGAGLSQIQAHCFISHLVTVVHTSRYTRPAKGAFPEDCYHDCLRIPWSTGPFLSNPGYTRARPTDAFFSR